MAFVRTAAMLAVAILGVTPTTTIGDPASSPEPIEVSPERSNEVASADANDEVAAPSRSIGLPFRGHLADAALLEESAVLRFQANTPPEQRFATDELCDLLRHVAERMQATAPGAPLLVGDLSREEGGYMPPHRSHRSGRDADLALFLRHVKDQPAKLDRFIRVRRDGTARAMSQLYRFDDKRNWELVRLLLDNPIAEVTYVFVSGFLRERLLAEAARRGEPEWLVERARSLLQSRGGAHDDHIHIRIACAPDDLDCRG